MVREILCVTLRVLLFVWALLGYDLWPLTAKENEMLTC